MESRNKVSHDGPGASDDDRIAEMLLSSVQRLALEIRDAHVEKECIWFRNFMLGTLNSAQIDFQYAEIGAKQHSPYLLAWSCRNLLELRVNAEFVLVSGENARAWKDDFLIDQTEFMEAIAKLHASQFTEYLDCLEDTAASQNTPPDLKEMLLLVRDREARRGPQMESVEEEVKIYKALLGEFGVKAGARPKFAGKIAELIGQKERFDPWYRICSKIMHRTAFSIASSVRADSFQDVIGLLRAKATTEFLAVEERIKAHFCADGLTPRA